MKKENLQEKFNTLFEALLESENSKISLKESEQSLKKSAAKALDITDKNGEYDTKKIKTVLMKKAVELKETGTNKLEEDLELMLSYFNLIKNKSIPESAVKDYVIKSENLKEAKSNFASAKKTVSTELEPTELAALLILAKEAVDNQLSLEETEIVSSDTVIEKEKELYQKIKEIKEILKGE